MKSLINCIGFAQADIVEEALLLHKDLLKCECGSRQDSEGSSAAYSNNTHNT